MKRYHEKIIIKFHLFTKNFVDNLSGQSVGICISQVYSYWLPPQIFCNSVCSKTYLYDPLLRNIFEQNSINFCTGYYLIWWGCLMGKPPGNSLSSWKYPSGLVFISIEDSWRFRFLDGFTLLVYRFLYIFYIYFISNFSIILH